MMIEISTVIGLIAGALTTISFVPQLIKIIMKKKADEISTAMYSVISVGMILWVTYGVVISSIPVILANTISVILCITIIAFKTYYENVNRKSSKGWVGNDRS
ncbi:MAG: SemiSWEET family sugar transporter [Thermoplasmata archaeon]